MCNTDYSKTEECISTEKQQLMYMWERENKMRMGLKTVLWALRSKDSVSKEEWEKIQFCNIFFIFCYSFWHF